MWNCIPTAKTADNTSHYMNNDITTTYGLSYWITQTLKTRRHGHTYVHTGARAAAQFSFRAFGHEGITFSYSGYGRSLVGGGHKYKVHARYTDSGKPVSSKMLRAL